MAVLNDKQRKFLKENIHLLQEGKFKEFYQKLPNAAIGTSPITKVLENSGINILKSLNFVPQFYYAFNEDLTTVNIPSNIRMISRAAFAFCKNLKEVNIPDSVSVIEDVVFEGCKSLESIIIPDSVTVLGDGALNHCDNLTNIKLSKNLTEIESDTFRWCESLKEIHIPDNVESIRESAFSRCDNLKKIYLGNSIKYISAYFGGGASSDKRGKLRIIYNGTIEEWNNIEIQNNSNIYALIECKDGIISGYDGVY